MASRESALVDITPEVLLKAYACGIFPMAESAEDPTIFWIEPEQRGIIPLDRFHVPARLARTVRAETFTIRINHDFDGVLDGCAEPQPGRTRTWINARIRTLYRKLYRHRPLPQRRGLRGRTNLSAASMASISAARFSARACSIARAMLRRSRSCIWWRG